MSAAELEWAVVLPENYPAHTTHNHRRRLTGRPLEIWLILLAEAQARGLLTDITPTFDADEDSDGTPWDPLVVLEVDLDPGTNLLHLFEELTFVADAEWELDGDRLTVTRRPAP